MDKGRNQGSSTLWEEPHKKATYIDSAYKDLLRQNLKASALMNRTKVLNYNQQHIVKKIENNEEKQNKLEHIRRNHSQDVRNIIKNEERKTEILQQRKVENIERKRFHQRQMSTVSVQKNQHLSSIKKEALSLKKENNRLIQQNRERQIEKKREVRNKIHNDIAQSRVTIQQFFKNKHESIIENNKEEIKSLNQKKRKKEIFAKNEQNLQVKLMEQEVKELKKLSNHSRIVYSRNKEQPSKVELNSTQEDTHPLLRRIQNVMNRYTKLS